MLTIKKIFVLLSSLSVLFASPVSSAGSAKGSDKIAKRESMLSNMMDFIKSSEDSEISQEDAANESTDADADYNADTDADGEIYVNVYFHREGEVRRMALDEYIMGVVYGEVPESYSLEALKAQAVAARSYAVYRIKNNLTHANGADVCTNFAHCQAWTKAENGVYPDSIASAVNQTHNIIASYEGKCINALYFSNSGGRTEAIENVWGGGAKPYLTSVDSPGESEYYDYCTVKYFTAEKFLRTVSEYTGSADIDAEKASSIITNIKRSESGRIISACAAGKELSGLEMREMLGTYSSNIYINDLPDGSVLTVSLGYGHGVGMSQCGAQAMALGGAKYDEILKHYYSGIDLEKLEALEAD